MTDNKTIGDDLKPVADDLTKHVQNLVAEINALATYQDSHTAIVVASLFDQRLEKALLSKMMQPLPRSSYRSIFDNYGSMLSTFSAKIDMAYALVILPKDMYEDLKTMNTIRNRFAHATDIRTFSHPTITGLFNKISGMDTSIPNIRLRFLNRMVEVDKHIESFIKPEAPSAS